MTSLNIIEIGMYIDLLYENIDSRFRSLRRQYVLKLFTGYDKNQNLQKMHIQNKNIVESELIT